jgi:hypothetical protein
VFQMLSSKDRRIPSKQMAKIVLKKILRPLLQRPKLMAFRRRRYPQFLGYAYLRYKSRHPKTFALKVTHRIAHDRRPILTVLSDKYAVREYVKEKVGERYLTKLFSVWQSGEKVDWENLPREFVAKCTHGARGSLIVREGAARKSMAVPAKEDDWSIELVNPDDFSKAIAESYFYKWMNQRYDHLLTVPPEWSYRNIPPKVIFEELLTTSSGTIPNDYKFFCFDGVCKFVEVDVDRFGANCRDFYTPQWDRMDAHLTLPNSTSLIDQPAELDEMIKIAETLSKGMDFVTVDLYDVDGRIVFGEISLYHGDGNETFVPQSMEDWVGSLWTLPSRKK